MFDEIFVKTFPGFLSIRNAKHQIIYLNEIFKDWIRCYTDVDPMGKTNQEIAAIVPQNVAEMFMQCHDASLCWQRNYGPNQTLKKTIPFKDDQGLEENTKYFEVLKYGLMIEEEPHIFTVGHDITEVYRENLTHLKALERIAYVDELTKGRSFNKFKEDAREFLKGDRCQPFVLIKLDIENFRLINKTFGFGMGDSVLRAVWEALDASYIQEQTIFARLADDEFVILSDYVDDDQLEKERKQFITRFFQYMGETFDYNVRFKEGVYIGGAGQKKESDIEELLELVNFAHRKAKQNPVEDVAFYQESFSFNALHQKEIENRMKKALADEEFLVYLQPKYDLQKEVIGGAEALVRWRTGDGQFMYPNEFIPLFEQNGFIAQLDFFMLKKVCEIQSKRIEAGRKLTVISVNFSQQHLGNKHFASDVCEIVDKSHVERKWIEIEFTETAIYENIQAFEDVLILLREAGFTVSMDDFGSGYSSLGLLKNLTVDIIKIDRSFFVNQKDEGRSKIVVGSMIDMAKRLGIDTVAEGVEEEVHIHLLRELGCDMVQGYYYAKPMPVEKFEALMDA